MFSPTINRESGQMLSMGRIGREMPEKSRTKSFLFTHFRAKSSLVWQQQPAQHQPLTNKPERRGFIFHEAGDFRVECRIAIADGFDDSL